MRLSLIPAVAIAMACSSVPAKSQVDVARPQVTIWGEILTTVSSVGDWVVELIPQYGGRHQTSPRPDGSFEFDSLTPGQAELRVRDASGRTLFQDHIVLRDHDERVSIRVSPQPPPDRGKGLTVSARELQHKLPRKVQVEYRKGESALKNQQLPAAVEHLKTTLDLDPAFADAHNDLGVAYLRLRDLPRSAEQFQAAVDLAPGSQPASNNLAMVLLQLKRYSEAAAVATAIIRHGTGSSISHYVAAMSLFAEGGSRHEVLDHLKRAADEIPQGRLLAARILADNGRQAEAVVELQSFLRTREAETRRPEVEGWLAELNRQ